MRITWQIINEIIGKKSTNIDDMIIKNFNEVSLHNITNSFAKSFDENINDNNNNNKRTGSNKNNKEHNISDIKQTNGLWQMVLFEQ
ncbi:putative uncharacterized protein DDB_G0291786 [Lucilia sericata]|uniref:putative uncharacterized protein DDB_G0291786 n=1 Tax=Lucilia sericata TaxID=13632 RepID=UPI0018A86036|nr:putative uncharacterized protein DDB_G0291786 [Lucilia sericata]